MQTKKLDAGQGIAWYGGGWNLFKQNPTVWVLFGIIFLVINFVLSLIPVLGPLVLALVTPLLAAGFLLGADDLRQGRSLEPTTLFRAFSSEAIRTPLLILGAILLGLGILASIIMMGVVGAGVMGGMGGGMGPGGEGMTPQLVMRGAGIGFVVMLLVSVLIAMCMFFALPLVTFDNVAAVEAVKTSFQAALTNIIPFLLFLIVYIVLMFIASIPFFLGLIVLLPIVFCAVYCAYEGVFK